MNKIAHILVDVDRNALITVNSSSVARNSRSYINQHVCHQFGHIFLLCDASMFGIINQKIQDLLHQSLLSEKVRQHRTQQYLNPFSNRYLRQCFRYGNLYFTAAHCFIFILYENWVSTYPIFVQNKNEAVVCANKYNTKHTQKLTIDVIKIRQLVPLVTLYTFCHGIFAGRPQ